MTTDDDQSIGRDANARMRRGVYWILIALAVGNMTGRLLAVNAVNRMDLESRFVQERLKSIKDSLRRRGADEEEIQAQLAERRPEILAAERRQRPFLSSNDRSRWLAIRALVDHGTFEIDEVIDRHVWNTIDMVKHDNRAGEPRLYSSKPPLLITLLAGEYWLLQSITGLTLADNPYEVGRIMLVTVNILPLALMMWLIARLAERFGTTDWGKIFVVATAALGTMLTAFAVVLNNHIVGAVSAAIALYAFVRIWFDEDQRIRWYALCGGAAAFTAANELPALAMLALVGAALITRDRGAWLKGFLPAAGVIVVAFFATNYWAHNSFKPPYMHRSESDPNDNWYDYEYELNGQTRESYWRDPQGVDRGEPSVGVYALHSLIGHHGVFSLTPVWLLTLWGLGLWIVGDSYRQRQLAIGILALTIICLLFYVGLRPQQDRNYGGMTSGFRWMFWFAPLWLVGMIPAADRAGNSRWLKAIALTLLAISVFSASYPTWNPWTIPWIEQWMEWRKSPV